MRCPVVSIPGGEPLIHKGMPEIVRGIIARKKFVYLCTNALLLGEKIDEYEPSPYSVFKLAQVAVVLDSLVAEVGI